MKTIKLLLLSTSCFFMFSCSSVEQTMQKELNKAYIGMSIKDFKEAIPKSSSVYLDETYSCYRLDKKYAAFGDPNHFSYSTRFFYFKNDKLWKIDTGEKAVDYRVRID